MPASLLLRAARSSGGLNQSALAARANTSQPDISTIESGKRVPTVDTLERLLLNTGHRIVAVPGVGPDAVDTAERITNAVKADNRDEALRAFLDYSDRLASAGRAERVVLSFAEPPPTGSVAWDAALAAVSDFWLSKSNLPKSDWVKQSQRFLHSPAAPHLGEYDLEPDVDEVPTEFRRRNVLIERRTLASI